MASQGSTFEAINSNELNKWLISFPIDSKKQTKIAKVLSSIDKAIEQTEAIIAKQQRIKTGLMQDLLSKGIDEHGNIRTEQTHAFKDSPLGRIPVEWDLIRFDEVFQSSPKNGIYKPSNQIGEGILLIGQTSFTEDRLIDFSLARRALVSQKEIDDYGIQVDDLLISRVFAIADKVGLPIFVHSIPEPTVYESNMLSLRINKQLALPKFIYFWLLSEPIRKLVISSINVSNQASINQQVLSSLPLNMPDISEQKRILNIIETETAILTNEKKSLKKFCSIKTALMQDLLSGKMRVNQLL